MNTMRKSRHDALASTGMYHKMWRAHDREHILQNHGYKEKYLSFLCDAFKDVRKSHINWHSFCIMANHVHEAGSFNANHDSDEQQFSKGICHFGHWMRDAHSRFGQYYNKCNKRYGRVAYDRPKTCEIQNDQNMLNVMIYGDLNPVRAGLVKHPKQYKYSSYMFYAYGKRNEYTRHLKVPACYQALGKTQKSRQKKYRKIVDTILRREGYIADSVAMEAHYIGDSIWQMMRKNEVNECQRQRLLEARGQPPDT
jgi:putative transposase